MLSTCDTRCSIITIHSRWIYLALIQLQSQTFTTSYLGLLCLCVARDHFIDIMQQYCPTTSHLNTDHSSVTLRVSIACSHVEPPVQHLAHTMLLLLTHITSCLRFYKASTVSRNYVSVLVPSTYFSLL